MMKAEEIAQEAISRLNKRITDEIFLIIQNDRDLMQAYLAAVEDAGKESSKQSGKDRVNQSIGRAVKAAYALTDADRESEPASTLISSHQKFV